MGFFDNIANAKTFESSNNWFFPGEYEVEIVKCQTEKSTKPGTKAVYAKVFCKVVQCAPPVGSSAGTAAPYKPGQEVKAFWDILDDLKAGNAKAFAMAAVEQALWARGATHDQVRDILNDFKESDAPQHPCLKHLEDVFVNGLVNGVKLEVSAFDKKKKDGSAFTRLRWVPTLRPADFNPKG